ncbi:glycosyltransferase 87 family protein [Amycolatopsis nigrescens]|uniref:glycosyltransferase 87 family protein n=1 Tax=Amycolatopsis nigrescens TaxID=381445 RepID=UPI00035C6B72|nr:glycosyltransferase 87 family protein [Amycolatopsis nigrescens]
MLVKGPVKGVPRAWPLVVLVGLIVGGTALWCTTSAPIDLQVYRLGSEALWTHRDLYGPLPPTDAGISLPFIYPPFAAIALTPLAVLPWSWMVAALFVLSLLGLLLTLFAVTWRMRPAGGRLGALMVAGAALPALVWLEPIRGTFGFGQVNLLLMALVTADLLLAGRRSRGIGVGLAAAIKLTPLAFLLYFLVRRDYRALGTAVATCAVVTGLAFVVAPDASARYWLGGLAGASGLSGSTFHTNQTILATLTRLGMDPGFTTLSWLGLSGIVAVAAATAMRRSTPVVALLLNATAAVLISPISWSHHWVWIAPALLTALIHSCATLGPSSGWSVAIVTAGAVFVAAPFRYLPSFDQPGQEWAPYQHWIGNSYVLLGLLTIALALAITTRAHRSGETLSTLDFRAKSVS